jgi:hypothetical protein
MTNIFKKKYDQRTGIYKKYQMKILDVDIQLMSLETQENGSLTAD